MQLGSVKTIDYSVLRIATGLYFFAVFVHYSFYADIISQSDFFFKDITSPFPSLIPFLETTLLIQIYFYAFSFLSFLFAFGIAHRVNAFLIWFGWASLVNLFIYIAVPSDPFLGWLILSTIFLPMTKKQQSDSRINKLVYWGAAVVLGLGYFVSGINKFGSPSWLNGEAFRFIISNPIARMYLLPLEMSLDSIPNICIQFMSWFVLAIEILFLPLFLISATRRWAWLLATAWHIGALILLDIPFVSLGMVLFHLYLYDRQWFSLPLPRNPFWT